MKEEILKRKMFSAPMSKRTTNVGIMAGFDDDEMDEDEAAGELTRRSPQSPEILMNNLRGDIRSVDARYEELAQMVGEEAAMETPPEVLALMQGQMAQQQGIGALPQAPQMPQQPMPPQMPQQPMPPQMAPQMPPEMAQQMPPQEAPLQMAQGGYVQRFSNGSGPEGVTRFPKAFSPEQLAAMPGYNPYLPPDVEQIFNEPGLETSSPESYLLGGLGAGRLGLSGASALRSRYFTPTTRQLPNLGQGLQFETVGGGGVRGMTVDATKFMRDLPSRTAGGARTAANALKDFVSRNKGKTAVGGVLGAGLLTSALMPKDETAPGSELPKPDALPTPSVLPRAGTEGAATEAADTTQEPRLTDLGLGTDQEEGKPAPSAMDRTKKYASDYERLFSEYLGSDGTKEAQKTQALLLLADAGLKLARGSGKPGTSFATELAIASEGIPGGLAKLSAQTAERETSLKMAAIQAAMDKVQSEDKTLRDLQIQELKNQSELFKYMLGRGEFTSVEDLGSGLTVGKTKGGRLQFSQDPKAVAAAQNSPFFLNPDTNPYTVVDSGKEPLPATDKQTRIDLRNKLSAIDGTLENINRVGPLLANAYGMPAAAVNLYNNVIVPFGASPNIQNAEAIRSVRQTLNQAQPVLAQIGGRTGRLAVQQEEWVREVLGDKPGSWFSNPAIAAKNMQILQNDLQNERQRVLEQLGLVSTSVRAEVPGLGIAEDPLIVPSDPKKRLAFVSMLSKQFSTAPNTPLFLKSPGGETARFTVKDIINTFGQQ
jgi:hypothetical protein